MNSTTARTAVVALARTLLKRISVGDRERLGDAPAQVRVELLMFPALAEAYFRHPQRAEDTPPLVTMLMFEVAQAIHRYLTEEEIRERLADDEVQAIVVEILTEQGDMPTRKARLLADAALGRE
ncbi:hypothetical protein [Actinoplanes sp. NPDC051851]|uniref:hypothetical protein n=1 Tax=Actinoplanes sp. NPDC051851 TaxID=3154753 RepID=UPI00344A7692